MPAGQEIELKFLIVGKRARIASIPRVGRILARTAPTRIETTYLDTPDERLEAAGLSLRLRKMAGRTILSLKAPGSSAIGRKETEIEIERDWPSSKDLKKLADGTILKDEQVTDNLKPLSKTVVDRAITDIAWEKSRIEASLDRGKVEAADQDDISIRELELELKEGRTKDLFDLAQELVAHPSLRLSFVSKGKRGASLRKGDWLEPAPATVPTLSDTDTVDTAFRKICEACILDFMLNTEAMAGPNPVEAVHKARIATRRLRSALDMFSTLLKRKPLKELTSEIKWLASMLGRVRDLDVIIGKVRSAGNVQGPDIDLLVERLHQERGEAFEFLKDALETDRCRMFFFNFVKWLHDGKWRKSANYGKGSGAGIVAGLAGTRLKTLLAARKNLPKMKLEELHDIRKEAKSLRYMLEFQNDLPRDQAAERRHRAWLEAMEDVQHQLGKIQDSQALKTLLRTQVQQTDGKHVRRGLKRAANILTAALAQKTGKPIGKAATALEQSA